MMLRKAWMCLAAAASLFAGSVRAELDDYGVVIGRPTSYYLEPAAGEGKWPHYVVNVDTPAGPQRAVINVYRRVGEQVMHREVAMAPFAGYNGIFSKPDGVHHLPFHVAAGADTGGALDYMRNSFLLGDIRTTPWSTAPLVSGGTSVPLWDSLMLNARRVYIFGEPYHNSDGSNGIHDVHQNQGNFAGASYSWLNGRWQDGGMIIEYDPSRIWIPRYCGFVPPCWGGFYLTIPNRTLVMTRFQVQQDFTDSNGHGVVPSQINYNGNSTVANGWVDYGPFWSGQMQVELDALSGNPDVYLQLGAPPTESSYRARSGAAGLGSEFLRDYAPLQWTYVRVRANGAASSWNIRFKYY
ncbi:MAG: DUF2278 family protein [Xanthomonadales bacterium]|nr:DUF2278 family protein [Xanthomonadales bacterium]